MKVLFVIQGEGRGHLTQAITLESMLRRNGYDVVEVLVGQSKSRRLPGFFNRSIQAPVKRFLSPNFLPTPANRRVSLVRSVAYNLMHLPAYVRSMCYIRRRIRETGADLVINFYELLTGLTYLFLHPAVPQVSIGHQYLFLHPDFRFPHKSRASLFLLRFFTRLTCIGACRRLALSFRPMSDVPASRIRVVPPLLRLEVLTSESRKGDYLHGYLLNAGFAEDVLGWHRRHPQVSLHFFWDKPDEDDTCRMDDTLTFHQIDDVKFLRYMTGCRAVFIFSAFVLLCVNANVAPTDHASFSSYPTSGANVNDVLSASSLCHSPSEPPTYTCALTDNEAARTNNKITNFFIIDSLLVKHNLD